MYIIYRVKTRFLKKDLLCQRRIQEFAQVDLEFLTSFSPFSTYFTIVRASRGGGRPVRPPECANDIYVYMLNCKLGIHTRWYTHMYMCVLSNNSYLICKICSRKNLYYNDKVDVFLSPKGLKGGGSLGDMSSKVISLLTASNLSIDTIPQYKGSAGNRFQKKPGMHKGKY